MRALTTFFNGVHGQLLRPLFCANPQLVLFRLQGESQFPSRLIVHARQGDCGQVLLGILNRWHHFFGFSFIQDFLTLLLSTQELLLVLVHLRILLRGIFGRVDAKTSLIVEPTTMILAPLVTLISLNVLSSGISPLHMTRLSPWQVRDL